MPKRVHDLAKELDVKSKVLLDKLNNLLKIDAKNHMALLTDEEVDKVLVLFGIKKSTPVTAAQNEEKEIQIEEKNEDKKEKIHEEVTKEEKNVSKKDYETNNHQKIVTNHDNIHNSNKVESFDNNEEEVEIKLDEADEILIEKYFDENNEGNVKRIVSKQKKSKPTVVNTKAPVKQIEKQKEAEVKEEKVNPQKIVISDSITVKELAEKLKKPATEIIKKLLILGIMATINNELDYDTAALICMEFGIETEKEVIVTDEEKLINDYEDDPAKLQSRPPIVVVMGHVDHGKTSLLDAIRETNVIANEAGGITQHIGAYSVSINGRKITFLDTPGHEAFTAMRARGAQVTDIAILVVAADDGIMPQTVEAINHAKAAGVSIIVAINKIDKPEANIERVKQELTQHEILVEDWGGDVIAVPVSAKTKQNIDHLLEMVLLTADILELKANPERLAKGTVVESRLDKGKGPVATVLVQNGTLNVGDTIIAGTEYGRIRAMLDDKGNKVKKAKPSTPVEIQGLSGVPKAGDVFYAVEDEKLAKQVIEKRRIKEREANIGSSARVSLDQLFDQIKQGQVKDLNIIVKADVQGSAEAVKQSLEKLSDEEVRVKIIHQGVGAVNESDVMLAAASNAIIIGFNVRPDSGTVAAAEHEGVDIRLYRIIYKAIEDVQAAMKGMLDPKFEEEVIGHAEVRDLFKFSTVGTIAGCYVLDGKIQRNADVRLVRDGIIVFEGSLSSLKRFKDDAKEVAAGYECGITLEKFNDIKQGDTFECYIMKEVKR